LAEVVNMPRLGQSMEEGTILQWFKKEGDSVTQGEPLLEVMSDKANFEVEAPANGTLRRILAQVDDNVPVNQLIAIIGQPDEPIDALLTGGAVSSSISPSSSSSVISPTELPSPISVSTAGQERNPISPRARRIAESRGIAVTALQGIGTGPGGRVLERDVVAFLDRSSEPAQDSAESARRRVTPLAAKLADDLGIDVGDLALGLPGSRVTADLIKRRAESTPPTPPSDGSEPQIAERIPLRGLRKLIADNVTHSRQTAPHVTLVMEVDMTAVVSMFPALQAEIQKTHGTKVTYTDLLIRAAAVALGDHPLCNAALIDNEIRVYSEKNIGVAVAAESGLLVPVIRNADSKALGDMSKELKELVNRCREGKQSQTDLTGGTFTITNLGAFGVDTFDPIIVPPQACILGVGRIAEKVVAVNGQPAVRRMINLCLSFDHRVLDGVPAAQFLQRVQTLLETPVLLFV